MTKLPHALLGLAPLAFGCSSGGGGAGGGGAGGDASAHHWETLRWGGSAEADPLPTHDVKHCGAPDAGASIVPFGSFFNGNGNTLGVCLGEPGTMNSVNPYTFFSTLGVGSASELHAANDFEAALIYAGPWIQVVHYASTQGDQLFCDGGFDYHDRAADLGKTSCSVHGVVFEWEAPAKVKVSVPDGQTADVSLAPMHLH
ncbi:MAG: hypothetical protein U0263_25565 [Polyangiaceae bacterium]